MDTNEAISRRSLYLGVGEPRRPSQFAPKDAKRDSLKLSPTEVSLTPSHSPHSSDNPSIGSIMVSPQLRRVNGPGFDRLNTMKDSPMKRASIFQQNAEQNRRGSDMVSRRSGRSTTMRLRTLKSKVEKVEKPMDTPALFKEYKYRKSTAHDTLVKVGPDNEQREIKRLSIFSAFGSRVTDTRPMSPDVRRQSRAFKKRQTIKISGPQSPENMENNNLLSPKVTPRHSQHSQPRHGYDSNFMTISTSNTSDDEESLTEQQKRLRKTFKIRLYTVYFVGVMISFKNKVKVYGALRPIEYLEEFESLQPKNEIKSILPILPTSLFSVFWALTMFFCLALTAVLTPIYISFADDENMFFYYLNLIMDIIFGIDVAVNFLTAYYDSDKNIIIDFKKICFNYLRMWFWIDIIAVIPIDKILQSMAGVQSSHKIFRLLRFPRLYKLFKILRLLKTTTIFSSNRSFAKIIKKLSLNVRITKIIQIFLNFAFLNHLVGCLWFFVARFEDFNPDTWVGRNNLVDQDILEQYVASLYWSFQTLTTVGYGDMAPQTPLERSLASIWIVIGVLVYTFTVGNLSALLFGYQMKAEALREKLTAFEVFAIKAEIPDFLAQKVRRFYEVNHKENACLSIDPTEKLKSLPANLRTSMLLFSYYAFINKIKVLQINANLTAALIVHFKVMKLKIGEIIFRQDDPCDEIYFIIKGTVKFITQKSQGIFSLSEGTYFGEIEIFEGIKRLCFCKALNSTLMLVCPREAFLKIIPDFPDIEAQMKKIAISRKTKLRDKVERIQKAEELEKLNGNTDNSEPALLAKTTEYINKILLKIPDAEERYEQRRRERKLVKPQSMVIMDPASLSHIQSPERKPRRKKRASKTPRGDFMMSLENVEGQSIILEDESVYCSTNTLKLPTKTDVGTKKRRSRFEVTPVRTEPRTLSRINDASNPSLSSVFKNHIGAESVDNLLSQETKYKDVSSLAKVDKLDTLMDQIDVETRSFNTTPKNFRTTEDRTPIKLKAKESVKESFNNKKISPAQPIRAETSTTANRKSFSIGSNLLSLVKSQGLKGLFQSAPKVAPVPERQDQENQESPTKTYQRFLMSGESDWER